MKWLLFDAVGTLIEPWPHAINVYHQVAREFGSQRSLEQIERHFPSAVRKHFGHGVDCSSPDALRASEAIDKEKWRQIVGDTLGDLEDRSDKAFERLWSHFGRPTSWRFCEPMETVFDGLSSAGWNLAIASNFDRRLHQVMNGLTIDVEFRHIFVSTELGFSKPDSRFFEGIADQLRVEPTDLTLVGDDWQNDIQGALNAGWHSIHISRGSDRPPSSNTVQVPRISSLRELESLLVT